MSAENWNELRQNDDPPLPPRPKVFGGTREIRFAPSGAPRTPLNLGSDEAMSLAAAEGLSLIRSLCPRGGGTDSGGNGFVGVSFHEASTHPYRSLLRSGAATVRWLSPHTAFRGCQLASTALSAPTPRVGTGMLYAYTCKVRLNRTGSR